MKIFIGYLSICLMFVTNTLSYAQWTDAAGNPWLSYQVNVPSGAPTSFDPPGWPNHLNNTNWGAPIPGTLENTAAFNQYLSMRNLFPTGSKPSRQNFIWSNSTANPSKTFYKMPLVLQPNSCKKIRLLASSDESREIWVNGFPVANVQWAGGVMPWGVLTDVDITPYLTCGTNWITAEVNNTMTYCNFVANIVTTANDINFYGGASYNTNVNCDGTLNLFGPSTDYPSQTTYQWIDPNGNFFSNLKNPLPINNVRNIHKGTYTVVVKVACCIKTYTVNVDFQSSEVTCINGPDTICKNDIDFTCYNIPSNCITWRGNNNRWSWGLKKLDASGNVINWPIFGTSPQTSYLPDGGTKCLKDLLQRMNLTDNQLPGKYQLYFYLDDPCGYRYLTKDIVIVESVTDTLPPVNLDICSYCTSLYYTPNKCQNNTTPEIYKVNGPGDYTEVNKESHGDFKLKEGTYVEICRLDNCLQKIKIISINKVNPYYTMVPDVVKTICPRTKHTISRTFSFDDFCKEAVNQFKIFPQFSSTPLSGGIHYNYFSRYFKRTYQLSPGNYTVEEPVANSCEIRSYNLIISTYPELLPVSYSVTMPCDTNCVEIGTDINIGLVGDFGQPFTAVWNDGVTGMVRTVCPTSLPKLYTVTYTNRWGCTSQNDYMIEKDPCCYNPCFDLPDTICEGESIIPDISCFEGQTSSYEWGVHGIFSPGGGYLYHTGRLYGNISSINLSNFENFVGGKTYYIDLRAWGPCGDGPKTIHRSIYIATKPGPFYSQSFIMPCDSSCILLSPNNGVIPLNTNFTWNDGFVGVGINRKVCPTSFPVSYALTYTNQWGCTATETFDILEDTCCEEGNVYNVVNFNMLSFHPIDDINNLYHSPWPYSNNNTPCGSIEQIKKITNLSTGAIHYPPFSPSLYLSSNGSYEYDYGCCKDTLFFVYTLIKNPNANVPSSSKKSKTTYELSIYPNPTNGTQVTLSIKDIIPNSSVEIYSINGQRVYQSNWKEDSSHQIDVNNWEKGVYIVRVISENRDIKPKKLIIQ